MYCIGIDWKTKLKSILQTKTLNMDNTKFEISSNDNKTWVCDKCQEQLDSTFTECWNCSPEKEKLQKSRPDGKLSIWIAIFSFLIPITGALYYLVNKDITPNKAKSAGHAALWGWCIFLIIERLLPLIGIEEYYFIEFID